MKLKEALDKGIVKVRLPGWNDWTYLEIGGVPGRLNPFAKLREAGCCYTKQIVLYELTELEMFEEWKPPK